MTHAELISNIEAFCAARSITESTFGKKAVNDGKLVARLRAGRTVSLKTVEDIQNFIAGQPHSEAGAV